MFTLILSVVTSSGLSAQVWTETIRTKDQLFGMLLPRLLAVAERAWHKVAWENEDNLWDPINEHIRTVDYIEFANILGSREIKRLTDAGFVVYLPPPGAR